MDVYLPGLRDRRIAAADESTARPAFRGGRPRQIYSDGSRERALSLREGSRGFDVRTIAPSRPVERITTVFLHQTTFSSSDELPGDPADDLIGDNHRLDSVIAHFVVRQGGTVIYLRDIQRGLNSISARGGIDIEFEGDYNILPEDYRRRDWPDLNHPLEPRLPYPAIASGRRLLRALHTHPELNIQFVHPHSQITNKYCPGPDIWMNVGEWAIDQLGWTSSRPGLRAIGRDMTHPAYVRT